MKIAALTSGGKDSLYAAYLASKENKLVCFVTIISENQHSYMFHTSNVGLTETQAKIAALPIISFKTEGKKEEELKDLKQALEIAKQKYKIQGIVSGAIQSVYQKERVDNICRQLNIASIAPLWHTNPERYLKELLRDGFSVIVTSIAAEGLTKDFLGARIDMALIEKIKEVNKRNKIHMAFEGGEAETLVLDCPLFKKKIEILEAEKQMESEFVGKYVIKKIRLAEK